MSIRQVALIFDNKVRPETTGVYCRRALGQLVAVEHFLPEEISRIPRDRFDLFCHIDDGLSYRLPDTLRPSVWWAIDTHLDFAAANKKAQSFDLVFAAQRDGAENLRRAGIATATWLPLACDPDMQRPQVIPKQYDWCFVGNIFPGPRAELIELLQSHFPQHYVGQQYFDAMARMYSASKLIFNRSIRNDINMRVFEAVACGSLLLTNDLYTNGQEELLRDGIHLATYQHAEELLDKARFYLKQEATRERLAAAGRAEILLRHTYRHRMESLLNSAAKRLIAESVHVPHEVPGANCATASTALNDDEGRNASYYRFARPEILALIPLEVRTLLDVGCGSGRLGAALKQRQPAQVYGVEWNPQAASEASAVLDRVLVGDVETLTFGVEQASLDAVVCGDILEHVREPGRLLRRLRELLKPTGKLIASIPNVQHHSVLRGLLSGDWSYQPAGLLDRDHLRFFTRREIEKLFHRTGYRIHALQRVADPVANEQSRSVDPQELKIGPLTVTCASPEEVDDYFTYQFLLQAVPRPLSADGLTSIVMVTHNQLEHTSRCIESIRERTDEAIEWIFVDNGSDDGTPDYLTTIPNSQLIRNHTNQGFPAAVNQGLRLVRGQQVVLLNNDTVVTTGWLRRLLDALQSDARIGLVGPSSNNVSGEQQVAVTYEDLEGLDGFAWEWGKRHDRQWQETDRLVGFCLLIRGAVFEQIGFLDEQFGIGCYEDDDYCLRVLQAGYRVVWARDAFVHHVGGQTFKNSTVDFGALLQQNEALFKEKWRARQPTTTPQHNPDPASERAAASNGTLSYSVVPGERGLRLLRRSPAISLCMIVRDNATTIRQALESIKPWVDEMVVVDTGSIDDTPQIAAMLGARVYHFAWVDDFAIARNESIKYACGDWIFWMDSDDEIDAKNGEQLRALVKREMAKDVLGFVVSVRCPSVDPVDPHGYTQVTHIKLFRNLPDLRFEHRIHEQILPAILRAHGRVEFTDLYVDHAGYDTSIEGQKRKLERDLRILHKELAEKPGHPFTLFNLGMTYADIGRHEEGAAYLQQCLKNSPEKGSHVRKAHALLCFCHQARGDTTAAWDACQRGLKAFPLDAELRFRQGLLQQERGELDAATNTYQDILARQEGSHYTSVHSGLAGHLTRHNLALVYMAQQKWSQAERTLRRVITDQPHYHPGWMLLGEVLTRQGRRAEAHALALQAANNRALGATGRILCGHIKAAEGNLESARREFETAVTEHPTDIHALNALSRFLFEQFGAGAAESALTALVRLDPKDAAARQNLGVVYMETKRAPLAVEQFREALRLRPGAEETKTYLGNALRACGLMEQAQRTDVQLRQQHPMHPI